MPSTSSSASGWTLAAFPLLVAGYSAASCAAMALISARAFGELDPQDQPRQNVHFKVISPVEE